MVGRGIQLGVPLRPPAEDGDNKGTMDDQNIIRQTKSSNPSTSHQCNHRSGKITTPATKQTPNDKGISTPAPNDDNNNKDNNKNDNYNNGINRGLMSPKITTTVDTVKRAKNSPPMRSQMLPPNNNYRQCQRHRQSKNNRNYNHHHDQRRHAHALSSSFILTQ